MPDTRRHRGAHPGDDRRFGPGSLAALRAAVEDFSLLLSRGYAAPGALKLAGDRHGLDSRQRAAVQRCSCTDAQLASRAARMLAPGGLAGAAVAIDGFNLLITLEAALGGGVVLAGRDGVYRDIMGVHGTWRSVEETLPALLLAGETLALLGASGATWLLDSPVSNSGRLGALVARTGRERGWRWEVAVMASPDDALARSGAVVASGDGVVLDACGRWVNLARAAIEAGVPGAFVVDMGGEGLL